MAAWNMGVVRKRYRQTVPLIAAALLLSTCAVALASGNFCKIEGPQPKSDEADVRCCSEPIQSDGKCWAQSRSGFMLPPPAESVHSLTLDVFDPKTATYQKVEIKPLKNADSTVWLKQYAYFGKSDKDSKIFKDIKAQFIKKGIRLNGAEIISLNHFSADATLKVTNGDPAEPREESWTNVKEAECRYLADPQVVRRHKSQCPGGMNICVGKIQCRHNGAMVGYNAACTTPVGRCPEAGICVRDMEVSTWTSSGDVTETQYQDALKERGDGRAVRVR